MMEVYRNIIENIIIVSGGDIDDDLLLDVVNQKLNPYIIGVDKGMDTLERLKITADFIVGDFDSADKDIKEKYASDNRTLLLNPIKDLTDTHAALLEAIKLAENKDIPVVIIGATGGRIDHLLGNIGLLKLCLDNGISDAYIIDPQNKIRIIKDYYCIKKKDLYGEFISLIPFSDKAEGVTLEGFKYNLSGGVLSKDDTLGISNELIKEEGRITVKSGYLLLLETKD